MNNNFLKTTDVATAEKLRKNGFNEIDTSENGVFVFLNCNELNFSSDIDKSKIHYSNMLCT